MISSITRFVDLVSRETCSAKRNRVVVVFTCLAGSDVVNAVLACPSISGVILTDENERNRFASFKKAGFRYGLGLSRWTFPRCKAEIVLVVGSLEAVGLRVACNAIRRNVKIFTFIDPETEASTTLSTRALMTKLAARSIHLRVAALASRLRPVTHRTAEFSTRNFITFKQYGLSIRRIWALLLAFRSVGDDRGDHLKVLASPYLESAGGNPVQALLYRSMEKSGARIRAFSIQELLTGSWHIWHLHWPCEATISRGTNVDAVKRLIDLWVKLKLAKLSRTRIVWTVHNLRPHERRRLMLERLFWWIFIPHVDGVISMSESGTQALHKQHKRIRNHPTFVIPHGHYRGTYPDSMSKEEARRILQIRDDEFVVTFIGLVRAYKGIPQLIQSFKAMNRPNSKLIVAGYPRSSSLAKELTDLGGDAENVRFYFEFVQVAEVQRFMRAADLIVLPYREMLNSGSAMLALSFSRPVLVPAFGALSELHQAVGSDWIRLYEGDLTATTLEDAIQWTNARRCPTERVMPLNDDFSWDRIGKLTIQAMQSVALIKSAGVKRD
jgi:glycosyltransferase involved in cell wall biosynthesis